MKAQRAEAWTSPVQDSDSRSLTATRREEGDASSTVLDPAIPTYHHTHFASIAFIAYFSCYISISFGHYSTRKVTIP
jgi:hypothetical protein